MALNIPRIRIEVTSAAPLSEDRAWDDFVVNDDGALRVMDLLRRLRGY
jgi:hypothetical protein